MARNLSRRKFLTQTGKSMLALSAAPVLLSNLSMGCSTTRPSRGVPTVTGFTQSPLPYRYDALEPLIDALTMEIHYSKHAATYTKNLNEAADAEGVDKKQPLENVLRNISKYSEKMRNNAGGHYNHELFWQLMVPGGNRQPSAKMEQALKESFGSVEAFKTAFTQAALNRFGSGWAWLVADYDGRLRIGSTPNQDNPLMDISPFRGKPLLALDVWEHAYYLKYQNRRAEYVANWWKLVSWDVVERLHKASVS